MKEISKGDGWVVDVRSCSTEHVIEVGLCIECNNCELACAVRHGPARLQRQNYQQRSTAEIILRTCKQCYDRSCVKVCNFNAMRIDEDSGTVVVGQNCVGCGLCAEACPYGSIAMVELPVTRSLSERAEKKRFLASLVQREKRELKSCANKCDLCRGYQDLACINQCPTGALRLRLIYRNGDSKIQENLPDWEGEELAAVTDGKKPCLQMDNCVKCSLCAKKCPVQAITMNPYPVIGEACIGCGACMKACPKKALTMAEVKDEQPAGKHPSQTGNAVQRVSESSANGQSSINHLDKLKSGLRSHLTGSRGEVPVTFHVEIKLDAQMTETQLRGLLSVVKSELKLQDSVLK